MSLNRTPLSLLALLLLSVLRVAAAAETMSAVPLDKLAPPAPGKAVVYFFVPGDTPVIPSIPLYDTPDQLPNVLGAREYLRYECDPGLHTFFIGSGLESESLPADRIPEAVAGKSLIVFYVPAHRPGQPVTLYDGDDRLGPELDSLWDSPGGALTVAGPADPASLKKTHKALTKKSKKKHSEWVPIR